MKTMLAVDDGSYYWDSIARRYIERTDEAHEALETFGAGLRGAASEASRAVASTIDVRIPDNNNPVRDVSANYCAPEMRNNPERDRGPYITTYTGRFYFNDPRPEDFEIDDIAHSLAMTRRYSGHGRREYTTAEHSVHIYRWLLAQNADADTRLAGLMHDAPEALSGFGDAASPRKKECPAIAKAEQEIWEWAIAPKYGLHPIIPAAVHVADKRICHDEMTQNLWEVDPNVGPPLGIELEYWPFEQARAEYLRAFVEVQRVRHQQRRVA